MSLYETLQAPPWSVIYFSIPVIVWALCFAYCHFTFDPDKAYQTRNDPLAWYERVASGWIPVVVGGWIVLATFRDAVLVLFD